MIDGGLSGRVERGRFEDCDRLIWLRSSVVWIQTLRNWKVHRDKARQVRYFNCIIFIGRKKRGIGLVFKSANVCY